MKNIKHILIGVVAVFLLIVIGYLLYLLLDYHRIQDNLPLDITGSGQQQLTTGQPLTAITYNIGFGAYTPDFSFFMDGGTESRAKSKDAVQTDTENILSLLKDSDPTFVLLQEVDQNSTRSYHVNQVDMLCTGLNNYSQVFAINYDISYLFYPFTKPHGKSLSGILTLSKYNISSSRRYSLPIETGLMKYLDLDRCYTVSRISCDNQKELVLYNIHLSAYTSDGSIATQQLQMLIQDMQKECQKGNYVICGGDFNKDLLGDSSLYFGVSGEEYTWAQPFPADMLKGTGLTLVSSYSDQYPTPSCRNADAPYHDNQFVLTVDGFIVSDNVAVNQCYVVDTGFAYSDHNPVYMQFILK